MKSDIVAATEEETGFELQVTVLPWHEWEAMKEQGDPFAVNVLEGHVLLAGAVL